MSITTWAALKELPNSQKNILVEFYPIEYLSDGWVLDTNGVNADIYRRPLTTFGTIDLNAVWRDGTAQAEVGSIGALDVVAPAHYWFNQSGQILYINVPIGDMPVVDYIYAAIHYMPFSDKSGAGLEFDGVVYDPRVETMPDIHLESSGLIYGVSFPGGGNIVIRNDDGGLDDFFNRMIWRSSVAKVYLGGEALPKSEYQLLLDGKLTDTVTWNRDVMTLNVQDKRQKIKMKYAYSPKFADGTANTNNVEEEWKGKPIPFCYGELSKVPVVCNNRNYRTATALTTSATTITFLSPYENMPANGGKIVIDEEVILFTGFAAGSLTGCSRGQDGTAAAAHVANSLATLIESGRTGGFTNYFNFLVAGHAIKAIKAVYKDGKIINVSKQLSFPSAYQFRISGSPAVLPIDSETLVADISGKESGGVLLSYPATIQDVLINLCGFAIADIDTASFTAAEGKVIGTPSYRSNPEDNIEDVLDRLLAGCLGRLTINASGQISLNVYEPVLPTTMDDLSKVEITNWLVFQDSEQLLGEVFIKYDPNWSAGINTNETKEKVVVATNPFKLKIYKDELRSETIETYERSLGAAQILAQRMGLITQNRNFKIRVNCIGLRFVDKRPGDIISIVIDRPDIDGIYEILEYTLKYNAGSPELELVLHDIFGLVGTLGYITDSSANIWTAASESEKERNMFISDNNGLIDPTDLNTFNAKVIW